MLGQIASQTSGKLNNCFLGYTNLTTAPAWLLRKTEILEPCYAQKFYKCQSIYILQKNEDGVIVVDATEYLFFGTVVLRDYFNCTYCKILFMPYAITI